ncbi:MAG: homocysteine S-methyltransferase family protein [Acidimicrobiales bacterium]
MTSPSSITVLDGGMGRELMRIGAPFRQPEWSALALLDGPDWVVRAHRNFIDAGAEVITTNSYAVVPFHLGDERFAARGHELAASSGELARRAADESPRRVRVAGSLPPLFGSYRPDLFDAARAPSIIDPLVDGLAPHVDVWLGETLGSIAEARAVRDALDRAGQGDRELWISYTLDDQVPGTLRSGEPVADAARAALDLGAGTVMFNCCQAETITVAIDATLDLVGDVARVGGYANRFVSSHTDGGEANAQLASFRDDLDPSSYGEFVQGWLARGATVVGGCCGMQPEHIARIAQLVAGRR